MAKEKKVTNNHELKLIERELNRTIDRALQDSHKLHPVVQSLRVKFFKRTIEDKAYRVFKGHSLDMISTKDKYFYEASRIFTNLERNLDELLRFMEDSRREQNEEKQ